MRYLGKCVAVIMVTVVLATGLLACGSGGTNDPADRDLTEYDAAPGYKITDERSELVNILMEDGSHIVVELDPQTAPITVDNFQNLVAAGFYDGLIFHRVIYGFMIQGGDPEGSGRGGSDDTIKGEFESNGVDNNISHERGVISMARSGQPNSASSQFFIVHISSPHLDGDYAAFGHVVYGVETVDQITAVSVDANAKPVEDQVMEAVFFVTEAD